MRLTTTLLESCAGESEGEFSSIVASPLVFLPSLDQPARPGEHLRRNRQADLLRGFRLITNSDFVGCSTGVSAGFVPFRILPTIDDAMRQNRNAGW